MEEQLNIEIKAKCINPEKIREILRARKADFKGIDRQIDTYFQVSHGRLKLRQGQIENALIYYDRECKQGPKRSRIVLYKVKKNSADVLKGILLKILRVLVIVNKKREIYFIGNVKFHIDKVKGLGDFLEIEVVQTKGISQRRLLEQCRFYLKLLNVSNNDFIAVSYSDLLIKT